MDIWQLPGVWSCRCRRRYLTSLQSFNFRQNHRNIPTSICIFARKRTTSCSGWLISRCRRWKRWQQQWSHDVRSQFGFRFNAQWITNDSFFLCPPIEELATVGQPWSCLWREPIRAKCLHWRLVCDQRWKPVQPSQLWCWLLAGIIWMNSNNLCTHQIIFLKWLNISFLRWAVIP